MPESSLAQASDCLVAIVDDESALRETLTIALSREGYRVEVHADGRSAWQAFSQSMPDLVVLDVTTPAFSG